MMIILFIMMFQTIISNDIQIMNSNYPLSTKSSKKSKKTIQQLPSPALLERSACQNAISLTLKPQDYKHILVNQRIFIELYYQGRVVSTAYNDYIPFMGGLLAKRLMPKVTIFLTNLDIREIGPIKDRVRKICPQCRIINILWFQQCYQQKQKVSFDSFALDVQTKKSEERSSKNGVQEIDLDELMANICEDAQNEYKQFFKNQKNQFFQHLPKNHKQQKQDILVARDIDLGPNQQKKARPKNENKKRRKSLSGKVLSERKQVDHKRQLKSLGVQANKDLLQFDEDEQNNEKQQYNTVKQQKQFYENKVRLPSLQNLMCKYLGAQDQIQNGNNEEHYSPTNKSKPTVLQQNIETTPKVVPSQRKIQLQKDRIDKQSIHSAFTECEPMRYHKQHRFTFSSIGTKYKDINKEETNSIANPKEVETLIEKINRRNQNGLVVMTGSRVVQLKVKEINEEAVSHSSISLYHIPYKLFSAFADKASKPLQIYFLLNPKKASERGLYLALLQQKKTIKLKLVSYRLIEQIMAYNNQIKNAHLRSPIKLQKSRIKFLKEISLHVQHDYIKGKRITFLQSQLPVFVQKKIIQCLGGQFILKQDYLLSINLDLIVTDRWGLKEKGIQTVSQQIFWKKLIKLQGQIQ